MLASVRHSVLPFGTTLPTSVCAAEHTLTVQAEEAAEYVNFLSSLPHLTSVVKENRRPLLPPQQPSANKKTLVLDLDHTLIRSTQHSFNKAKVSSDGVLLLSTCVVLGGCREILNFLPL